MADILAVDDESSALEIIERAFRNSGHRVVTALGGGAALEAMQTRRFDVAVVDYRMPVTDGMQVLLALRERQPRCVRVLMSGSLDLPMALAAVNRGEVTRLIEKPFRVDDLVSILSDALATRLRAEERERSDEREVLAEQDRALRECLERGHLRLALQPIVRGADATVVAHEALLRSSHPTLDNVGAVLVAAEQADMVSELTTIVALCASRVLAQLPAGDLLFMNLHPAEFGEPERLARSLEPLHPLSARVVIEITERRSVLEIEGWRASVSLLGQLGYALAVDDLGAGYSSLSVLAEIEPRYMKVDMSIVRDVHVDPRKRRLVELLVRFAEATGSQLIAEGVEVEAEAATLRGAGVHLLQGYYFGRPTVR